MSSDSPGAMVAPGATLSHYRIDARLGAGGMGEVFRATDTRLNRQVALKVSKAAFSPRFRREAEVLAALSHPHICTLFDVGADYLVMELLEGETLQERLGRGPVSGADVLRLGAQIADALAEAHVQGITHRDLKPGNVMLTRSGIKLLDFGLASLTDQTHTLTMPGAVMGTPAYMAPEQRQGLEAGPQTDIYALGLLLYEMATGKRPVLRPGEPPAVDALPDTLAYVVGRCLAEEPGARWRTASEVSALLEFARHTADTKRATPGRSRWAIHAVWAVVLAAVAGALLPGSRFVSAPVSAPTRTVDLVTPPEADAGGIALSPDGTQIAYTGLRNGVPRLYVRSLESGSAEEIPGTEGAALPFWSPSNRSLAFFAESTLKRLDLDTRTIRRLADATLSPGGGTWGPDGVILFARNLSGGLYMVPDVGGRDPRLVVERGISPRFLHDGQHFLFGTGSRVLVASLGDTAGKELLDPATMATPGPAGHLLIVRRGSLYAQRFDEQGLQMTGAEIPLSGRISVGTEGQTASLTASTNGVIAFRDLAAGERLRSIGWFDRGGAEVRRITDRGGLSPALSPDDTLFAFSAPRGAASENTVWLQETAGGVADPFVTGSGNQTSVFSPDGRLIAFATARNGFVEMFTKPLAGGDERAVFDAPENRNGRVATDWRGDYLLYRENSPDTNFDIWVVGMNGPERQPQAVLRTPAAERDAQFSPDMHWIAYESNKSGTSEIYLTRFPTPGREFRISTGGGAQVRWNPANQNELFYVALDGRLMAARLQFSADGATVSALDEMSLFQTRIGAVVQGAQTQLYAVSRDGQRFLVSSVNEDAPTRITLIDHWTPPAN